MGSNLMGLIMGDICGSLYEFKIDGGTYIASATKALLHKNAHFTDDTVMACAIAVAVRSCGKDADEQTLKNAFIDNMKTFGRKYPNVGYGKRMKQWIMSDDREPYESWGNGSAMRVYEVGKHYDTLERTLEVAQWSSEVTHNHPDAIAAARAVAGAIFLARKGSKEEIKEFVEKEMNEELIDYEGMIFTSPFSKMDLSARCTVPVALDCFLNGDGVIPTIEEAINRGGDTDTIAAIAAGIADAFYKGIESESCYNILIDRLPTDLSNIALGLV